MPKKHLLGIFNRKLDKSPVMHLLLIVVLLFCSIIIPSGFAATPRKSAAKGIEHYNKEEFDKALTEFLQGLEKDPDRPELRYDLGTALYRLQQFPQAAEALGKAANAKNKDIARNSWFNLGNTMLNAQKFDEAIGAYKQALRIDSKDTDAKHNLELALQMKKMQMQQQQQSSQDSSKQENKTDQKQDKQNGEQQKNQEQQQMQQAQADTTGQDSTQNIDEIAESGPMSREDAQKLLQALEREEEEAQKEKLRRQFGQPRKVEKDW